MSPIALAILGICSAAILWTFWLYYRAMKSAYQDDQRAAELSRHAHVATRQVPLHSGFGATSTATDVIAGISLAGKTALVTGGYSGLGLETVRVLAAAGANVVVPARDPVRAAKALDGIDSVQVATMDLLDPVSIDAFAGKFLASHEKLHLLINSAGIMACPLVRDARGYESQFATNHLGHFQLTAKLWPALVRAHGARVIAVSSRGHRYSPVVFDDIHFERRAYDRWQAYGQSKTANVLFAVALDRRGMAEDVRAFSLHPGSIVETGLGKHVSQDELKAAGVIDAAGKPILDTSRQLKTVAQGAATIVWAATSPKLAGLGGVYCENCDVAGPMVQEPKQSTMGDTSSGVLPYAVDPALAERLWNVSEKLIK